MKRLLKKLTAGIMAGVMALGMVCTASADNVTGARIRGSGKMEGKPTAAMKIVVPTLANNDLNMILDPHSMIALTEAEAWKDSAGRTPTFEEGSNIFFRNKVKNTTPKTITMTVSGDSVKAKVFKKIESNSPAVYAYRAKEPTTVGGNTYNWFTVSDGVVSVLSPAPTEITATTDPNANGATTSGGYLSRETESVLTTANSGDVVVIKYENVQVTGRWLVEGTTAANNKVYTKSSSTLTTDVDPAFNGKGEEDLIKAGYVAVPSQEYAYDYSSHTDDLKIINKSYVPLTVRVEAELDKKDGSTTAQVKLVDAPDKLINTNEDGTEVNEALMYLALADADESSVTILKDPTEILDEDDKPTGTYEVGNPSVLRAYSSPTQLTGSGGTVYNVDLIKGQPVFYWDEEADDEAKTALNNALAAATESTGILTTTSSFKITYTATGTNKDTFGVTALTGASAYTLELVKDVEEGEEEEESTGVKGNGVSVPVLVNIKSGDSRVAYLKMTLDGYKAGSLTADVTSTGPEVGIAKWEPKSELASEVKAVLPVFENGFKLKTSGSTVTSQDSNYNNTNIVSGANYAYEVNPIVPDSRFNAANFHIKAGINTVDAWDLAQSQAMHLALIYNVNQYNATNDGELPQEEQAGVTVVTPFPANATTSDSAVMKINLGTGNSGYDTVTGAKFSTSGGAEKAVSSSGFTYDATAMTVTIKFSASTSSSMAGSTGWKMIFKNNLTNQEKEVSFDIFTATT